MDQVTSPLLLSDGAAIDMVGFECDINDGYARVAGLDRWNGERTPSTLNVQVATLSSIATIILNPGDVLIGTQSNATMIYWQRNDAPDTEGRWIGFGNSEIVSVLVSDVSGEFYSGEDMVLERDITAFVRMVEAPKYVESATAQLQAQSEANLRGLCRLAWRKPGDGPTDDVDGAAVGAVLGTAHFQGKTWVMRRSAANTNRTVFFTKAEPGNGRFYLRGQWESSFPIEIVPEGARFSFVEHNFFGATEQRKLYGVSGTGQAFQFDGTTWSFISTEQADINDDKPTLITVHANRLALAIGSSLFLSKAGTPDVYDVVQGATEVACGDDITNILPAKGSDASDAMMIITKSRTYMLYGTADANYKLIPLKYETGGVAHTAQALSQPIFLSDFGITSLVSTDAYGGFRDADLAKQMKPWLDSRRRKATASVIVRNKNQYRIFFDDGYALYLTMQGNKVKGMGPVYIGKVITAVWTSIEDDGTELILLGAEDGGVYRMEQGHSIDGDPILWHVRMAFNYSGKPRIRKRYRRAVVDLVSDGYVEFEFGYDLDFGNTLQDVTPNQNIDSPVHGDGGRYDDSNFDEFYYDDAHQNPATFDMVGHGDNVSVRVHGLSDAVSEFRITGVIFHYDERRFMR